jgi:hypothetical protein
LAAVGKDLNDNIYPIAIAVFEVETKDSWSQFLKTLVADLGPNGSIGWTFISDRQKVCFFFFFLLSLNIEFGFSIHFHLCTQFYVWS